MTIRKGDAVWIERVKDHGVVQSVARDGVRAVVSVGKVNVDVPVVQLREPRPGHRQESQGRIQVARTGRGRTQRNRELDLHGFRVEEAIPLLDQFIDKALLDGVPEVRLIHGLGSGAIRKAVHQRLKALGILRFRLGEPGQTPGGDGVTIVTL